MYKNNELDESFKIKVYQGSPLLNKYIVKDVLIETKFYDRKQESYLFHIKKTQTLSGRVLK